MWQRLKDYFLRHTQVGLGSLGQLSRSPVASLMTCLVIGITLALPAALFTFLKNAEVLSQHFQQTLQLTLFLKSNSTSDDAAKIAKTIKKMGVKDLQIISPTQGLKELQQQEGFEILINELPANPLPWAIVVLPNAENSSPDKLESFTQQLKQLPQVDSLQMDMNWVNRLITMIDVAHRAVYALAIFLSIAVFLIINSAIRSATQHNQKEIEIIKLIGGTHAFIRRPFLYAGVIYGLLGGIIAWQLVDIFLLILRSPAKRLSELYGSSFQLLGMGMTDTAFLLAASITLGFAGAWMAVTRHLRSR